MGAGPAHAVHFGTYELVKDFAGGNRPGHQPLATGAFADTPNMPLSSDFTPITLSHSGSCCNHHERCPDEPL